jgi:hypothetical protein
MEYTTPEDVETVAEELGTVVSPDHNTRDLTLPGKYASESRAIIDHSDFEVILDAATLKAAGGGNPLKKVYLFQVDLKGGLTDSTTGRRVFRPDRTWISTRPRRERVYGKRDEFYPGVTSDVTKYLLGCGYTMSVLRNLSGIDVLRSILAESQDRRAGVRTGLGPRGKKTGARTAKGKDFYATPGNPAPGIYEGKKLYTKSFSDGNGGFHRTITIDGVEWEAQETIEGWVKLTA